MKKEIYCNICKQVKTDVHPLQNIICASCNEQLKYTETGTKMITVQGWGNNVVIVQYKPIPKGN